MCFCCFCCREYYFRTISFSTRSHIENRRPQICYQGTFVSYFGFKLESLFNLNPLDGKRQKHLFAVFSSIAFTLQLNTPVGLWNEIKLSLLMVYSRFFLHPKLYFTKIGQLRVAEYCFRNYPRIAVIFRLE